MRETEDFIFEDEEESKWRDKWESIWFKTKDFFESWIYPGYYLRNLLFHRYDRVKLPLVKPWEYVEPCEKIKYAVFEIVCKFVEMEEKHPFVEWYGEHGAKIDGIYVMDTAKEIRDWWRTMRSEEVKKSADFQSFYCKWVIGKLRFHTPDKKTGLGLLTFEKSHLPKTFEEYEKVVTVEEWKKFDAFCDDRHKIMDENFMRNLSNQIERNLDDIDDKYLHEAIKIRQYLWT